MSDKDLESNNTENNEELKNNIEETNSSNSGSTENKNKNEDE